LYIPLAFKMQFKILTISIAIAELATLACASTSDIKITNYYDSFTSQIDPTNITVPSIKQTTSDNPTTECTYYDPETSLININNSEFPTVWDVATSNGMSKSAEFLSLYHSIDWTKAPNISVRTTDSDAVEKTYQEFVDMGSNGTFTTGGNIVLTHEIDNLTMSLALEYLPKIQSSYKQVLDVATCANITNPYFENYQWP
ncbi:hypothetical protein CU098_004881, partial [Rhizopus stolonifer]